MLLAFMETTTYTLEELRTVAARLLAAAVVELFPGTLLVSARPMAERFVYDFVLPIPFSDELLRQIEERMGRIIREKREAKLIEMVPVSAAAFFKHQGQPILAEQAGMSDETLVPLFQLGEFTCESEDSLSPQCCTELKAFRLLEGIEVGEYFERPVTRISGAAFFQKDELKEFIKKYEPSASFDHLELGEELDLFSLRENLLWHPRGEMLRHLLIQFLRGELLKNNFQFLSSACAADSLLESHSNYFLHTRKRTLRTAEIAYSDEREQEGWERGLLTPKQRLIDRAFIFCPKEELQREVISSLQFILRILKILHFKFKFVLSSSRREKQKEKEALSQLEEALKICGASYTRGKASSERSGPAIEVRIEDGMGQEWTGSFIELNCRPKSVKEEIISLSLFNSLERGTALLLENKGGEIPLWLAPVQVELLGVEEEAYAKEVFALLQKAGIRVELDLRGEKLAKRMHEALRKKTPWVVLVGEREKNSKLISIRSCNSSETEEISVEGFIQKVMKMTQEELA